MCRSLQTAQRGSRALRRRVLCPRAGRVPPKNASDTSSSQPRRRKTRAHENDAPDAKGRRCKATGVRIRTQLNFEGHGIRRRSPRWGQGAGAKRASGNDGSGKGEGGARARRSHRGLGTTRHKIFAAISHGSCSLASGPRTRRGVSCMRRRARAQWNLSCPPEPHLPVSAASGAPRISASVRRRITFRGGSGSSSAAGDLCQRPRQHRRSPFVAREPR